MINEEKQQLQDSVVNGIIKYNNYILQWGTGAGKGYTATKAIGQLYKKDNTIKVLIAVAERAHITNWKDEFSKIYGEESKEILECITIVCYASLKKYVNTEWSVLVLDEAHHINTPIRINALKRIKAKCVIALSATLKRDTVNTLEILFGSFIKVKLSLQESIDKNILPEPKIILIPLLLDNRRISEIIEFKRGKSEYAIKVQCNLKDRWQYLRNKSSYPNLILNMYCTQLEKYNYINEQYEYYRNSYLRNPNNVRFKNQWLQWGNKRKRFLGELKTKYASNLCHVLKEKNKRFICFCSSINQAEELGKILKTKNNIIHSKKQKTQDIINKFNSKELNELYCVSMLVEGQNLNNIEAGVIVQLDGEERVFLQKFGRVMRADSPVQYIFYYKGTRDEEYLNKAIEGIDKKYIKVYETNNRQ